MSGGVVIGMFQNYAIEPHRQFYGHDVLGELSTQKFSTSGVNSNDACIISEQTLNELKTNYLDKLLCKNDITDENYDGGLVSRLGSFQRLLIIMQELGALDTTNSDYNTLLVEVMRLFTSLLNKAQAQHVEILLLRRKLSSSENLVKIKNQEIENLKYEIDRLNDNLGENVGFDGTISMTARELPNQLLFLMHIDIVRAWYYHVFGAPDDCDILDPDNVNYIFSYLGTNFNNLQEAKDELRRQVNES